MVKKPHRYQKSLFIFRRDLRLRDNTGLIAALQNSHTVIPCFIFDTRQCVKNTYKSLHSIQFMIESLEDLQQQLKKNKGKLFLFYGICEKVVSKLLAKENIDAVYCNKDYTPFSQMRDEAIQKVCQQFSVDFHSFDDLLLSGSPLLKPDGSPYKIFHPFFKKSWKIQVSKPVENKHQHYFQGKLFFKESKEINTIYKKILPIRQLNPHLKGGRSEGAKKIKQLKTIQYGQLASDYLIGNYTTDLSPYLKFNIYSVREVYAAIKKYLADPEKIIRELYWRDFFTLIGYYFPHVFGQPYQEKYKNLPWDNNKKLFKAWCTGTTGFPIIDAGMRQLSQTGYLRNRVRLITASFLVKDLRIDWRWGERYFAQKLIDYDPAVNNGNWQWIASTGTSIQPYFRLFNPWIQQKHYDPECIYIKKWVTELQALPKNIIHHWYKSHHQQTTIAYQAPIVDHHYQAENIKAFYRHKEND